MKMFGEFKSDLQDGLLDRLQTSWYEEQGW